MIDSLFETREWAKGLLNDLENSPVDTFHVRIAENRKRWQPRLREIPRVSFLTYGQPLLPADELGNVIILFEELYHYFDKAYKAPHCIDELPGLCKEALNELLTALDRLEVQTRGVKAV